MSSGKSKPSTADAGAPLGKKPRGFKTTTCDKWVAEYDGEVSTSVWLSYERSDPSPSDRSVVENLKCKMCSRLVDKIRSRKNFSDSFVVGSRNLKTSAFKDHAASEMHRRAMALFGKEQSSGNPIEYAPIARALCKLDDAAAAKACSGKTVTTTILVMLFSRRDNISMVLIYTEHCVI